MNQNCMADRNRSQDRGPAPLVVNLERAVEGNSNFRTALWTGKHLQMTLMCIPVCGEIGVEMHPDTDQVIRVEDGQAFVQLGKCREISLPLQRQHL